MTPSNFVTETLLSFFLSVGFLEACKSLFTDINKTWGAAHYGGVLCDIKVATE
jgi:hypothetical protein